MQMTSTLLKITGNDSYTGPTTISAGTIQLGNSFALGNSSTVSFGSSSAVLDLDSYSATIGALAGNGTVTNTAASGTSTLTLAPLSGSISTFRGVIRNGTATVAVTINGAGTQVIAGTDTYSGSTTITAGTLQLGSTTALASSMPVTIGNNGVFDLGGFSPTLASLTGTGIVFNGVGGASTLIFAPTSGTSTYGGSIRDGLGTVALTISATGTEVLTGSSTYSGPTTISSGTLQLGNGGNTGSINGSSGVTDNTLLVFDVSGTATFSPVISGVGNVTQNSGGVMILTASNTYSGLTTISNGTLQIGNGGPARSTIPAGSPATERWPTIFPAAQPSRSR